MASALVRGGRVALGLAGVLLALVVHAGGSPFVVPGSRAVQELSCVEPTDFMRRNHMEVIKHQRDETVHGGIRATKHSLAGCVACHVAPDPQGRPLPVNADRQFCGTCHDIAAVRVNCFDCHATVPKSVADFGGVAVRGAPEGHVQGGLVPSGSFLVFGCPLGLPNLPCAEEVTK